MRLKSWPFWETWKLIFGQDRAQGNTAEDIEDAAQRARPQGTFGSECNENDYHPSLDDIPVDHQTTPIAEQPGLQEVSSGAERRRIPTLKSASTDDAFMEFLANLHAETNSRLEVIAARIGYEFDMGKAQREVFDKLGTVDGLTLLKGMNFVTFLVRNHNVWKSLWVAGLCSSWICEKVHLIEPSIWVIQRMKL